MNRILAPEQLEELAAVIYRLLQCFVVFARAVPYLHVQIGGGRDREGRKRETYVYV